MKYVLKEDGYGKYKHIRVISVTDKKAREYERDGIEVFNTRSEALSKKKSMC